MKVKDPLYSDIFWSSSIRAFASAYVIIFHHLVFC